MQGEDPPPVVTGESGGGGANLEHVTQHTLNMEAAAAVSLTNLSLRHWPFVRTACFTIIHASLLYRFACVFLALFGTNESRYWQGMYKEIFRVL